MTLKVIGAGFGRTGTLSLKAALERLGFDPCYHMRDVFAKPEHAKLWEAAAEGEPVDWEKLLEKYKATVDWPGCTFYEELMQEYPDAKVLLNVRDPDEWYESVMNTIYMYSQRELSSPILSLIRLFWPNIRHAGRMIDKIIWEDTFDGKFEDRQYAIEVFNRHNEEVKKRVPAERLLVYELKEGWGPLCEFLDVEEPEGEPFPHLNDTATMQKRVRQTQALALTVLIVGGSLIVLALLLLNKPESET
jgi:Sulfotransferase domain